MPSPVLVWLVAAALSTTAAQTAHAEVWREDSFEDFRDGTFGDGGANTYVSHRGRIQTVTRWDLNSDGYIDIVMANSHRHTEGLNLAIFWGNGKELDSARRSLLPAEGAYQAQAADLNADGAPDLILANYNNGTRDDNDAYIYLNRRNDANGTSPTTRAAMADAARRFGIFERAGGLPARAAKALAVGDLNKDGHPEVVLAFATGKSLERDGKKTWVDPARVYWGSASGPSGSAFAELPAESPEDVKIGDLNGDGWPDVVLAQETTWIYWGGRGGFTPERRSELPAHPVLATALGDVDDDGDADLVLACGRLAAGIPELSTGTDDAEVERSFVYFNDGRGRFDAGHRLVLPTFAARGVAIADFDRDGAPDIFFSNHERHGNRVVPSFLYYGSKEGFSTKRRELLTTFGAWGATAADLNADGWVDLVVSNFREHTSFDVPSFVYWNSPNGFDATRRTPLYTSGAAGNVVADFDGDGAADVAFCQFAGRSLGEPTNNFVYWGDAKGNYSVDNRLVLPGNEGYGQALSDLNDDGQVDLLICNSGEVSRPNNEIWIFWNERNQFSMDRRTGLPVWLGLGLQVADLDRDGYIDVIASNYTAWQSKEGAGCFVYWGGPQGYVISQRTRLDVLGRTCAVADLNRDGHLDLVFGAATYPGDPQRTNGCVFWGDGGRGFERRVDVPDSPTTTRPEIADLNRDGWLDLIFGRSGYHQPTLVYYGAADGTFSSQRRVELGTGGASIMITVADVNADGWLDVISPIYKDTRPHPTRRTESPVWLGGPDGFSAERRILLPTDSGTGAIVSDFNFDGHNDIFFYCHRLEGDTSQVNRPGDHMTNSFLYWGGPDGFDASRRLELPGEGVHSDNGMDLGDVYNRTFVFAYTSSAYEHRGRPSLMTWSAQTPHRSAIRLQVRVGASRDELEKAPWVGPAGPGSYFTKRGSPLSLPPSTWIQYRAELDTDNGAYSPVLDAVEIHFADR
jgi:hypothetical protein